jgi:hypothetical protein
VTRLKPIVPQNRMVLPGHGPGPYRRHISAFEKLLRPIGGKLPAGSQYTIKL